jgi:hypothetical protein
MTKYFLRAFTGLQGWHNHHRRHFSPPSIAILKNTPLNYLHKAAYTGGLDSVMNFASASMRSSLRWPSATIGEKQPPFNASQKKLGALFSENRRAAPDL